MQQTIYGEVLFLFNFSIDFLVLLFVGCFMHLRRRLLRLLPAALFGGVYGILALLPQWPFYLSLFVHILMAGFMCAIAYAPLRRGVFVKLVLLFYAIAVLWGGFMQVLLNALAQFFGTTNTMYDGRKSEIFMLYAAISAAAIFIIGRILAHKGRMDNIMLVIEEEHHAVTLEGLIDSGNFLRDPLSGKPVILVHRRHLQGILPDGIMGVLAYGQKEEKLPMSVKRKVRIILAHGADGSHMMVGYTPDKICLYKKENPRAKETVDAIVAIGRDEERDFAGCGAIVPAILWR